MSTDQTQEALRKVVVLLKQFDCAREAADLEAVFLQLTEDLKLQEAASRVVGPPPIPPSKNLCLICQMPLEGHDDENCRHESRWGEEAAELKEENKLNESS